MKNVLFLLFTAVHFWLFCQIIDLAFRNCGISFLFDILAGVCWIIALVVSIGLGDFTVKKVEDYFRK